MPSASRSSRPSASQRQLLGDVEHEPRARVLDELDGGAQRGGVAALGVGARAPPRGRRGGRARARPAATQATSRNQSPASWRPWSSAPVRARRSARLRLLAELGLAPLALLLGQEVELLGASRSSAVAGGGAARCRRASSARHGRSRAGAAVQRRAGERLGGGAQRGAVAGASAQRALAVAERQPRARERGLRRARRRGARAARRAPRPAAGRSARAGSARRSSAAPGSGGR